MWKGSEVALSIKLKVLIHSMEIEEENPTMKRKQFGTKLIKLLYWDNTYNIMQLKLITLACIYGYEFNIPTTWMSSNYILKIT